MDASNLDRLAILTVSSPQSGPLMKELSGQGFQFTIVNSTGGVVQETLACMLIGFQHERFTSLLEIIHTHCKTYRGYVPTEGFPAGGLAGLSMVEAQMGGALIHVMNVERFEQF